MNTHQESSHSNINTMPPEEIVTQYNSLVARIGHHLMWRLPPGIALDDLMQAGMIGLIEASKNYNPNKGASFETYAGIRIRGHMLDEVRRGDWAPRSVYRKARLLAESVKVVEKRTGKDASDKEVADEMGVSQKEYYKVLQDSNCAKLFHFEELGVSDDVFEQGLSSQIPNPVQGLEQDKLRVQLSDSINNLPEREKLVLSLYYDDELNLKEIGEVLGVTESRVSQIHSKAMGHLQDELESWRDYTQSG